LATFLTGETKITSHKSVAYIPSRLPIKHLTKKLKKYLTLKSFLRASKERKAMIPQLDFDLQDSNIINTA